MRGSGSSQHLPPCSLPAPQGPLGTTNFRLLEEACMIQTLRDAEALVFMERNFPAVSWRGEALRWAEALQPTSASLQRVTKLVTS